MKYKLLKDLPLAKAGTEVFIYSPITSGLIDIRINEGDGYFNISCLKKENIPEWLEEVKEHKTIYDLKKGDEIWVIHGKDVIKNEAFAFAPYAHINVFLTEREAKRNKLLRELATRTDKWLPEDNEECIIFDDEGNSCTFTWESCSFIIHRYHEGLVFRNEEEYNKYITEEAKDLLFNI